MNFDLDNGGSCYDCGSTIKGHHTPRCEMSGQNDIKDLPEIPGTQWWTETVVNGCYVQATHRPRILKESK